MNTTLPFHLLRPENPDFLQHAYGLINGLFLSSLLFVLMAALSYARNTEIKTRNHVTMSNAYLLMATSFLMFSLYNVFYQGFSGSVSTQVLPGWLFSIAKFGAPIAVLITTYIFLISTEIKSYRAYRFQQQFRWAIIGLYSLDVVGFTALFFIDNDIYSSMLIQAVLLPHCVGAVIYCFVGLRGVPYAVPMGLLFTLGIYSNVHFFWLTYTGQLNFSPEVIAANHFGAALACIAFAFISVRYGHDEVQRFLSIREKDQHHLIHGINRAIQNNEFFLVYQPQLDLNTNKVCGLEALIRWQHPERGLIPPNDFIGIAEEAGKIDTICQWVISAALAQQRAFIDAGNPLRISINFSVKNLNVDMLEHLRKSLAKHQVPGHLMMVEITETFMVEESSEVRDILFAIEALGINLSLDDYGTGFSSLSYINRLALTELKIDRSFISNMDSNAENQIICRSTIKMSKSLNISVVAEGVESAEVMDQLNALGCDMAQGFYIAKPMPIKELNAWLQNSTYT